MFMRPAINCTSSLNTPLANDEGFPVLASEENYDIFDLEPWILSSWALQTMEKKKKKMDLLRRTVKMVFGGLYLP